MSQLLFCFVLGRGGEVVVGGGGGVTWVNKTSYVGEKMESSTIARTKSAGITIDTKEKAFQHQIIPSNSFPFRPYNTNLQRGIHFHPVHLLPG